MEAATDELAPVEAAGEMSRQQRSKPLAGRKPSVTAFSIPSLLFYGYTFFPLDAQIDERR
jgi:hypothetical protein